jgi:hypothetical protein
MEISRSVTPGERGSSDFAGTSVTSGTTSFLTTSPSKSGFSGAIASLSVTPGERGSSDFARTSVTSGTTNFLTTSPSKSGFSWCDRVSICHTGRPRVIRLGWSVCYIWYNWSSNDLNFLIRLFRCDRISISHARRPGVVRLLRFRVLYTHKKSMGRQEFVRIDISRN